MTRRDTKFDWCMEWIVRFVSNNLRPLAFAILIVALIYLCGCSGNWIEEGTISPTRFTATATSGQVQRLYLKLSLTSNVPTIMLDESLPDWTVTDVWVIAYCTSIDTNLNCESEPSNCVTNL